MLLLSITFYLFVAFSAYAAQSCNVKADKCLWPVATCGVNGVCIETEGCGKNSDCEPPYLCSGRNCKLNACVSMTDCAQQPYAPEITCFVGKCNTTLGYCTAEIAPKSLGIACHPPGNVSPVLPPECNTTADCNSRDNSIFCVDRVCRNLDCSTNQSVCDPYQYPFDPDRCILGGCGDQGLCIYLACIDGTSNTNVGAVALGFFIVIVLLGILVYCIAFSTVGRQKNN